MPTKTDGNELDKKKVAAAMKVRDEFLNIKPVCVFLFSYLIFS